MTPISTQYLFNNTTFRTQLINNILNGAITIDTQTCKCIYQVKPKDSNNQNKSLNDMYLSINLNQKQEPDHCSYATTLANLGFSLEYIGSDAYSFTTKVCEDDQCSLTYALKMIPYMNQDNVYSKDLDNPNRPENIELEMIKKLNMKFLYTRITPHILCYIQDFKCNGMPNLWDTKDNHIFAQYVSNHVHTNKTIILLTEMAKYGSLEQFILTHLTLINHDWLLNIVFQFIYTLAQIQTKYPGFRHNNCYIANLLLQQANDYVDGKYYIYYYNGMYFKLATPYQIKLTDFDMSNINGITNNQRFNDYTPDEFGYRNNNNQYYDLHLFVNTLLTLIDQEFEHLNSITDILQTIVPIKYQGISKPNTLQYSRLIPDIQFTTPHQVLINHFQNSSLQIDLDQMDSNLIIESYGIDLNKLKQLIHIASNQTDKII